MGVEAAIAAVFRRAERHLTEHLRDSGAMSYETAQPLFDMSLLERKQLRRLLSAGAIQEADADKYFLDEVALDVYNQQSRKKILLLVGGAIVALLALIVLIGLIRK